jgi:hypothetical protein
MRHGTRPVTLRTRWLTIGEGGHVSNSSSIYGTRPVKILWSMLPPLKLLNSSGADADPVILEVELDRMPSRRQRVRAPHFMRSRSTMFHRNTGLPFNR